MALESWFDLLQTVLDGADGSSEFMGDTGEHHFSPLIDYHLLLQVFFGRHIIETEKKLSILSRLRVHLQPLNLQVVVQEALRVPRSSHVASGHTFVIEIVIFVNTRGIFVFNYFQVDRVFTSEEK